MRVAVGAVVGSTGGPATYAVELVRALVDAFPSDRYTVITDAPEVFSDIAEAIFAELPSPWWQPVWDHVRVPAALARGHFDLYHGTKGVLPLRCKLPCVVTIHDLADRVLPESFRLAQRLHLRLETGAAIARARAIITVSRNSESVLRHGRRPCQSRRSSAGSGATAWKGR